MISFQRVLLVSTNSGIEANAYRLSEAQSLLVYLEDTKKVGAEIGKEEEIARGVQNSFMGPGLGLLGVGAFLGRVGENIGFARCNG